MKTAVLLVAAVAIVILLAVLVPSVNKSSDELSAPKEVPSSVAENLVGTSWVDKTGTAAGDVWLKFYPGGKGEFWNSQMEWGQDQKGVYVRYPNIDFETREKRMYTAYVELSSDGKQLGINVDIMTGTPGGAGSMLFERF